jgi:hypothetical protein
MFRSVRSRHRSVSPFRVPKAPSRDKSDAEIKVILVGELELVKAHVIILRSRSLSVRLSAYTFTLTPANLPTNSGRRLITRINIVDTDSTPLSIYLEEKPWVTIL